MLSHDDDYRTLFETSQRVNWKMEDVVGGKTHRMFDRSLRELSPKGHERVGRLALALS